MARIAQNRPGSTLRHRHVELAQDRHAVSAEMNGASLKSMKRMHTDITAVGAQSYCGLLLRFIGVGVSMDRKRQRTPDLEIDVTRRTENRQIRGRTAPDLWHSQTQRQNKFGSKLSLA